MFARRVVDPIAHENEMLAKDRERVISGIIIAVEAKDGLLCLEDAGKKDDNKDNCRKTRER